MKQLSCLNCIYCDKLSSINQSTATIVVIKHNDQEDADNDADEMIWCDFEDEYSVMTTTKKKKKKWRWNVDEDIQAAQLQHRLIQYTARHNLLEKSESNVR
jgi:hypothetical protein